MRPQESIIRYWLLRRFHLTAALDMALVVMVVGGLPGCQPAPSPTPSATANSTSAAATNLPPIDQADADVDERSIADSTVDNGQAEDSQPDAATETADAGDAPVAEAAADTPAAGNAAENATIVAGDWPQWGGTTYRNNTPIAENIPANWNIGTIDRKTGEWSPDGAENIKWVSHVGSQTYGNPVVAGGQVFIGTNNGAGYLRRYPARVDLGCLLCFRESDGEFLWQHSSEKLPTGRVNDWPRQGICCAPLVEGDRLWFVSSRGHVVCVDTEGYYDGEDDGPVQQETSRLFREGPLLHSGLDDGVISDTLRAVLTAHDVNLDGRVRVQSRDTEASWLLTVKIKETTDYYQIRRAESQLDMHRLESEEQQDPGDDAKIFTVDSQLDAGLAEGRVSGGFRALCRERGFAFEQDPQVTVDEAGQKWTATVDVDGVARTLQIRRQGPALVCNLLVTPADVSEADTVWVYDMMSQLQVFQHNMCSCSVTVLGDILFVNTSNGVDNTHINIPSVNAASFMAMNKHTGEVYWTDASPGENILHGQWSSPTVGTLGGVPQVIFGGGDGWIYSFRADKGHEGKPELLWRFDANPKTSKWAIGGRGTRNNIIATPVIYDGLVYAAVGQDPEHGDGVGHLWCIDPTKRGDVSSELAVRVDDREQIIPHRRLQAVVEEDGEVTIDNPNSAVVWHFDNYDQDGDSEIEFHEEMHRSCGTVAIQNDILYIADFSGIFHCLHAKTGKVHWSYDMFSAAWGSPLIVDGKVYIGDEEGEVSVFPLTTDPAVALVGEEDERHPALAEVDMGNSVYSTPIVANGVLFIANRTHIFAITNMPDEELADRE